MKRLKKIWKGFVSLFDDEIDKDEPGYDPVHIGALIVISLFGIGGLFWLFWTLLVFQGGILPKILPALSVLFTSKKLSDYGWEGYPYEMGVFNGWIGNGVALAFLIFVIFEILYLFRKTKPHKE